jgi:hypothetical protein
MGTRKMPAMKATRISQKVHRQLRMTPVEQKAEWRGEPQQGTDLGRPLIAR